MLRKVSNELDTLAKSHKRQSSELLESVKCAIGLCAKGDSHIHAFVAVRDREKWRAESLRLQDALNQTKRVCAVCRFRCSH